MNIKEMKTVESETAVIHVRVGRDERGCVDDLSREERGLSWRLMMERREYLPFIYPHLCSDFWVSPALFHLLYIDICGISSYHDIWDVNIIHDIGKISCIVVVIVTAHSNQDS